MDMNSENQLLSLRDLEEELRNVLGIGARQDLREVQANENGKSVRDTGSTISSDSSIDRSGLVECVLSPLQNDSIEKSSGDQIDVISGENGHPAPLPASHCSRPAGPVLKIGDRAEVNSTVQTKTRQRHSQSTTQQLKEEEIPPGHVRILIPPPPLPVEQREHDLEEKYKTVYPYCLPPLSVVIHEQELERFQYQGLHPLKHINPRFVRAFLYCKICSFHMSSMREAEKHLKDPIHVRQHYVDVLKRTASLLPAAPRPDRAVAQIFEQYGLSEQELNQRLSTAQLFKQHIEQHVPGVTVRYYGSSFTGLGLKDSDVNVSLVLGKEETTVGMVLLSVFHLLSRLPVWTDIEDDLTAKIPVLRFRCTENGLRLSLVIDNNMSHQSGILLQQYSNLDPRLRVLAVALRVFARLAELDQPELGTLPPHAFSIMALYFMQQKKILPVLHDLAPDGEDTYMTASEYLKTKAESTETDNLSVGQLWLDLLRFYAWDFSNEDKVVSIRSLKPVRRSEKNWGSRRIAIEDPFRTNVNMGSTMNNPDTFSYFKCCFYHGHIYFGTPQLPSGPLFTQLVKQPFKFPNVTGPGVLTVQEASERIEQIKPEDLHWQFTKQNITRGMGLPVVCSVCTANGHRKKDCPELQVPELGPLIPVDVQQLRTLDMVCWNVFQRFAPKHSDIEKRELIRRDLEKYIQCQWKDARLFLFGSSANGFGFADSDLDICLMFASNPEGKDLDFSDIVLEVAHLMRKNTHYRDVVAVASAKVPIVKFVHKATGLEADISLYNQLGLWNSRLLSCYAAIDPRVRVIGCMAKVLAKQCDVGDASRGSLSSYAYTLMAIHYLQRVNPPVIPVLQELSVAGSPKPQRVVDGWDTWFYEDLPNMKHVWPYLGQNQQPVSTLWLGFLVYFARIFNFSQQVICIRQMKPLFRLEKMWNDRPIAIEDPFELSHNLGAGVCPRMGAYIRRVLVLSARWFHTPVAQVPQAFRSVEEYYFYRSNIIKDPPPKNERGCNNCGKIGHKARDCQFESKGTGQQTAASDGNRRKNKKRTPADRAPAQEPAPTATPTPVKDTTSTVNH